MAAIHELLDEVQKKCQALVKEMETFKDARILHQKSAESLKAACDALADTSRAIKPFTERRVRKITVFFVGISIINMLFFLTTLLLLLVFKN